MSAIRVNENDVLLGRGGRNHEHEGNEQLRRIAHNRVREYEAATKKQKAVISREILRQIKGMDPPGRFLRKNYSTYEWEPVSDRVAREKVCQVSLLASKHQDSLNRSYFYNVLYSKSLRDAVAVERDQRAEAQVPADPLPDVLDVLSSEQLPPLPPTNQVAPNQVVPDSSASSHQPFERPRKPEVRAGGTGRLITPPRLNDVEGDRVDAYYFRSGYSEDFDLFNGQLTEVDWR